MDIPLNDRVTDIKIANLSFTPEGQSNPVNYRRLVLSGVINGTVKEVQISVGRDQLDVIEAFALKNEQQSII